MFSVRLKTQGGGAFDFVYFKDGPILFKMSKIHCFYCSNSQHKIKHAEQDIEQIMAALATKIGESLFSTRLLKYIPFPDFFFTQT